MITIFITVITSLTMLYFHPNSDKLLPNEIMSFLFQGAGNYHNGQVEKARDIIDDNILGKFTKFYGNRDLNTLKIYEKEEIRTILENMGYYNITKLVSMLKDGRNNEEEIYNLLNENLFEEQISLLNQILRKRDR
ncbi:hypothetical protein [Caminicella sporogenes]|uniref:hypothetical protein n=1 Tax=Caminicella sporogenes TaxID=166485 RepID=UPI0009346D81|nr:hypothetical protein [Caminicella sporogenes]RKD21915.1 hypothetical protein BET04_06585 [Caminicella sporogenes]